ncbi:hypothetical protein ACFORJ_01660 [Corynebacterium hansenii]|uniref:Uncharacterized protein n=1 Tax=Corynebacterium hansenii TaxID=394964 RepID=A0ABV7ZL28_9CORY|nr:hypothetical protein [Corynebacterium hansenii]WJY99294.1 hypothetical protein CHAN_03330 [Corynebacterium hansenii]
MCPAILYTLHSVAAGLQLLGGGLVVADVKSTMDNARAFKADLEAADAKADEHRNHLKKRGLSPEIRSGRITIPKIQAPSDVTEAIVNQVGPSAAMEREAMRRFLRAQFPDNRRSPWLGVALLVGGIITSLVANLLGVS